MRHELEQGLMFEYSFFRPVSLVAEVCQHGDGWYGLLKELLEELKKLDLPLNFKVVEVKEKLGGLRVHVHPPVPECPNSVGRLLLAVKIKSFRVCEMCGRDGRWREHLKHMQTLCDAHCDEVKNIG